MKKLLFLLLALPIAVLGQVPTVTTNAVTNNTTGLKITCGGNVTSQGGSALTQRGVVWATVPNPTINPFSRSDRDSARTAASTTSTGTYSLTVAPLLPSTTYYIRAYATNGSGTAYGNEVTFTTPAGRAPSKFYFSSTLGNDTTGNGSITTPWRSLRKLESFLLNGNTLFVPGDSIFFRRGDVFANGTTSFATCYWVRNPVSGYFTAPSGRPGLPIVLTNYGDPNLPLPNILRPETTPPVSYWPNTRPSRATIEFAGVSNIVVDGLQSDDYRLPSWDKITPAYTGGFIIGEYTNSNSTLQGSNNPHNRIYFVRDFVVKNCRWNNTMFGLKSVAAMNTEIAYNTITNLKSGPDTAGVNDVMAGAFEAFNGFNINLHHNYVKGAWAKSGRISSTGGLGGVGIDIFNLKNSRIAYNTFIDCSGMFEIGNLDQYDTTTGAQLDTFAFNKIINCGNVGYIHGTTGSFVGNNYKIALWNNVVISNHKDRQNGPGFGADVYGDSIGFRPGTYQPWWSVRNPLSTWNVDPIVRPVLTTAGSNVVTVQGTVTGISVGSVAFINNDSLLGKNYQTVTVTAINTAVSPPQLTLSVPATYDAPVGSTGTSQRSLEFYLPVSDPTWSEPLNSAYANWGGSRVLVQYSSDSTRFGRNIDTLIDARNNIMYWTTGTQGVYDRNRFKRSNNIYSFRGVARFATSLGGTLNFRGTGEQQITNTSVFVDTSATYPENWNVRLATSLRANAVGAPTPGFNRDFDGNLYTTPFIGLYSYTSTTTLAVTATATPILCNGGSSTVTVAATGGTPPYTGTGTYSRTAGTYTFAITDATGASATATVNITQPSALSITDLNAAPNGSSLVNFTATVTAVGGTPPYSYMIKPAGGSQLGPQGSNIFSTTPYGSGIVTVTDANGCQAQYSYTINATSTGRKFYVSAAGNNNNDGLTPNTAWATLSKVSSSLSSFVAGDSIFFRRGDRFSGSINIQSKTGLYFGAYGTGANPLFWGTGSTISALFRVRTCSSMVFRDLTISDTTISRNDRTIQAKIQVAFVIEASSTGNTVKNVTIDRVGQGVYITGTSPGQTIDSCDMGNLRMIRNDTAADNDYGAVPVQLSSSNHRVTNNYFHDCWAISYDYGYDGGGIEFFEEGSVIQNNFIAYNTFYDCNGTFEFGSSPNSIADNTIQNNTIAYNKFINNSSLMYYNNNGQYRTRLRNLQFYNNICLQDTASRTGTTIYLNRATTDTATSTILVLKNNVFRLTTGTDMITNNGFNTTQFQHTNNIYDLSNGSVTNFTLSTAEANASSRYWADTTNSSPLLWNYSPRLGGQLINTGADLGFTRDFAGVPVSSTPDIGILEYQASAVTLLATATVDAIRCFGGTTTVTVSATGGVPPYTGTGTFTRSAGPYSYTVTDAVGSVYTITGNITQPAELVGTVSYPSISCNGGETTVVVGCTGGTPPYTGTGSFIQPAGSWGYLLSDANNCATVVEFTITQPPALSLGVTTGTIATNGGSTTATASATGGTGTYEYSLDNGAFQTSANFSGVLAGPHTMTVRDQLGCTTTISFTLSQPGPAGNRSRLIFVNQ